MGPRKRTLKSSHVRWLNRKIESVRRLVISGAWAFLNLCDGFDAVANRRAPVN